MDIRKRLGEILDAASAGERILIERDHQPLAYLVSVSDGERLSATADEVRRRRLAALDRLEAFAAEMRALHPPGPDDLDAAALVRLDRDRDEPGHDDG
jgi:prevent-host-death family protein